MKTDSEFIDTVEDLGWTEHGLVKQLEIVCGLQQRGFHDWPKHVPAPLDGYEYEMYGPLLFSKPRCSRWHRFIHLFT